MTGSGTVDSAIGIKGVVRDSQKTNLTTIRDSGSYLFNGSNRTSYVGNLTGKTKRHVSARETKLTTASQQMGQDYQKQKMMNAILDMNVHSQADLILIFSCLQDPKRNFKVLCGCLALEKFLQEEQRLENHEKRV